MARGDHIYVDRGIYTHHGVDVGSGYVIEFTPLDGNKWRATVRCVRVEDFAADAAVQVREYGTRLAPGEAVARAEALLGTSTYHLVANNCEHVATWCVAGEHASRQVESATAAAGGLGLLYAIPAIALALVVDAGGAAPRSGPNLMSGLANVGGTAKRGIFLVGVAGAAVGAGAACVVLRDKPTLTDEKRQARRAGRHGAIAGGAVGVGGVFYAVGAAGVAGYSGAGISSGLAALGSVAGGGMAVGVMLVALTPALLAALGAYLLYRLTLARQTPPPNSASLQTAT